MPWERLVLIERSWLWRPILMELGPLGLLVGFLVYLSVATLLARAAFRRVGTASLVPIWVLSAGHVTAALSWTT